MKTIIVKQNQNLIIPVLWVGDETELSYGIKLAGDNASVKFLGLLIGCENQSLNLSIRVDHIGKNTKSDVVIKGALFDTSKIDIDGLTKIEKGAKGTNAWLGAHILLLSEKAKGKAVPSLEILENDIKAGHASTVGRINDMEMFYLMSRGLSKEIAKSMIVNGFLQSMINEFPESLAKKANKIIQ